MWMAMRKLRDRMTYANVTATLALFVALGGTSYAVSQLPRNSVGSAQIRSSAVGTSELRKSAVRSRAIRDGSVALQDISKGAQSALRAAKGDPGPQGPAGVTLRAVVNSGGGVVRGNATGADHQGGSGRYAVAFDRDVSGCVVTAALSDAQNGPTLEVPPAGRISVGIDGARALVRTFAADGSVQDLPFSVIVAC
jgi:hypothetical protein